MTPKKKTPLELAQEHWAWVQELLTLEREKERALERKLFIDAFVHGYKHGKENKK